MADFQLVTRFTPRGDQPRAIAEMTERIRQGRSHSVLLGVTGSGKTFTMANVIAALNRPVLVIAPNKTLAAQLYAEFRGLFPGNAVEYFVSYYDYYQPEAYIPASDTYIQKDSSINEMIDKLRHSATRSVLTRRDVVVVASVSCIYGLGAPEDYLAMRLHLARDMTMERDRLLRRLVEMQYERNDVDFHRGTFRVRGDRVDIYPAYEEDFAVRVTFFGDDIETISEIDPLRGVALRDLEEVSVFPASHYVAPRTTLKQAMAAVRDELKERVRHFRDNGKLIEAQRIEERTNYDLEMMLELGYCTGIENYSRHLTARGRGEPPPTLLEYFPEDFLVFMDESHICVPQVRAMYRGDRSRKSTLVEFGFRLPSALDNRPLMFEEFEKRVTQVVYVSATPADYELERADHETVELIVRPTGLVDPDVQVRPAANQVDHLYGEIRTVVAKNERVLVTTLTKRMAEDLTEYYTELGIRVRYLHADISTLERMEIIRDLRAGVFDVLVGINLLREGLDLPEVSLVAILDADKEGFLRSTRSLVQTFGRAARNVGGRVVLYADRVTAAMEGALAETRRRQRIQRAYNRAHGIVPATIEKEIATGFEAFYKTPVPAVSETVAESMDAYAEAGDMEQIVARLEAQMAEAVADMAFEKAAVLRDRIKTLKARMLFEG